MAKTNRRWGRKAVPELPHPLRPAGEKALQGLLPWHEDEAGHRRGPEPSPRLLVLDEATAGLDPIVRDEVLEIFNEFTREEDHSILISSHNFERPGEAVRLYRLPPPGAAAVLRREGSLLEEYGIFVGTADQVNSLQDGAVVARENSSFGGVRCLVKRALVPAGWALERPTVEDIRPVCGERSEGAMSALLLKDYYVIFRQMKIFPAVNSGVLLHPRHVLQHLPPWCMPLCCPTPPWPMTSGAAGTRWLP